MLTADQLYRVHVENLRSIGAGLEDVYAAAKTAIARGHEDRVQSHQRLYAFLLGAWSECRLLKLIFEPRVFTDAERADILKGKALDRWHIVLEAAYRRHYLIPTAPLEPPALNQADYCRLTALRSVLDADLGVIISLRNRLAHGQWVHVLNSSLSAISSDLMNQLQRDNLLTLKFKASMVESLCACVHDVVVSRPTFERDFDVHFRNIEQLRTNVRTRDYAGWTGLLRKNYSNGQAKRSGGARVGG